MHRILNHDHEPRRGGASRRRGRSGVLALLAVVVAVGVAASDVAGSAAPSAPYIVVLQGGVDELAIADEHSARLGAEVSAHYSHALKGYAARLTPHALAALGADPRVAFVSPDFELRLASQTLPTGIDRVDGELSSTASGDGAGSVDVNIAILDTGIDLDHPDLNVAGGFGCVKNNNKKFDDDHGHGTHVAGTAAARDSDFGVVGVAAGARLWAVKVLDNDNRVTLSWLLCGIDWVTGTRTDSDPTNDIAVANMSIAATSTVFRDDQNCGLTVGDPLHLAICRSVGAGITYVAAAGNDAVDFQDILPAAYDEVLTVTAIRDFDGKPGSLSLGDGTCGEPPDDGFARFSNFATLSADQAHTISAPGVCIVSTFPDGDYGLNSGTSMATPHVTGIVALCLAAGRCTGTPSETIGTILADAENYNKRDHAYGFLGDPRRPVEGKYFGYLARAALY